MSELETKKIEADIAKILAEGGDAPRLIRLWVEANFLERLETIAHHTSPWCGDGAYRFDSADDACDFAYAEACRALGRDWEKEPETSE